jgi:cell division protein FtsW (lipid II flippase)
MIYAVITSELGLFGAVAILIGYLLFVWRGFKTAMLSSDSFSKLMAVGLTSVFALQVFVIVGGVTRVMTLPFISYGGASIVANFVLVALLLLVSNRARRPTRPYA